MFTETLNSLQNHCWIGLNWNTFNLWASTFMQLCLFYLGTLPHIVYHSFHFCHTEMSSDKCVFINILLIKSSKALVLLLGTVERFLLFFFFMFCVRWEFPEMEALVATLAHRNVPFHLLSYVSSFVLQAVCLSLRFI